MSDGWTETCIRLDSSRDVRTSLLLGAFQAAIVSVVRQYGGDQEEQHAQDHRCQTERVAHGYIRVQTNPL